MSDFPTNFPKNFTLKEMLTTSTGLPNFPETWDIVNHLVMTANRLQRLRDAVGFPIIVNSGFRTKAVNEVVGGSKTSAHVKGMAADIRGSSLARNKAIVDALKKNLTVWNIDQLIVYMDGDRIRLVHVGWRDGVGRSQVMYK